MTKQELDIISERLNGISDYVWDCMSLTDNAGKPRNFIVARRGDDFIRIAEVFDIENYAFIAKAPEDMEALLDYVQELSQELSRVKPEADGDCIRMRDTARRCKLFKGIADALLEENTRLNRIIERMTERNENT